MGNSLNVMELGHAKTSSLLWKYALPAIIGTMVNSLYNIIDRIFIGHWVGDDALSALGIIMPLMNLTAAVGMLVGAGSASRISISLGEKDIITAEKIVGTSFLMTLVLSGTVIASLFLFLKPVLLFAGASENTLPYAYDFMLIFLPGNLFLSLCFNFNNMMRASGYPFKAMLTMLISVVANIVLAYIFIKPTWFNWGIKGAAAATFLSMVIGFVFVMHHFMNANSYIRLRLKYIFGHIEKQIVWAITSIGLSPFLMQVVTSAIVFLVIGQLRRYSGEDAHAGDVAIAAYTLANTLIMLIVMVVIGLTQGMQPIVGYNYGAKNYLRVKDTLTYTIKVGVCITAVGFVLGFFFPQVFVRMFGPSELLADEASNALHYLIAAFPLAGFQIVATNFFQSIGMAGKSIFLSLTRQVLFLLPLLYLFPHFWGVNGVWLSMPAADCIAAIVTAVLIAMQIRAFKRAK
ncbi:MAG: MATE family efflux transporter [Prevotella sp.]|jgi:putative MATE family efflux protein|nr:MATE family efflux transporter [Prevotella sp.]